MTLPNNKASLRQIFRLQGDKTLWVIYFFLCAVSLIEVYSAGSWLTFKHGNIMDPITSHLKFLVIGFILVWIVHNIPCRWFKLWAPMWVIFVSMLLFLTLFGKKINDGARWIELPGFNFQPSELAKGSLIVCVAIILSTYQTKKGTDRHALKYILILTSITCGLIFTENFSTAAILFAAVMAMMFFGRVPMNQLGKLILGLSLLGAVAFAAVAVDPIYNTLKEAPGLHRLENARNRIGRFIGKPSEEDRVHDSLRHVSLQRRLATMPPEDTAWVKKVEEFDLDREAQVGHANIAIAKSHIIGCGPGNSRERDFLYQPDSDYIFAIIVEETGLIGGLILVLLYIILMFRASRIAKRCERNFPAFLVLGLATIITLQATIHMCVSVGLLPVTGQPLPLISRGGTSILATSIYFGMMLSVSRFAKRREAEPAPVEQPEETTPEAPVVNEEEFQR